LDHKKLQTERSERNSVNQDAQHDDGKTKLKNALKKLNAGHKGRTKILNKKIKKIKDE